MTQREGASHDDIPIDDARAIGTASVTVIMPIRNEANYIEQSLGAVFAQDYPPDRMQVLVVDGNSTDQTRNIVKAMFARRPDVRTALLDNPGQVVPTGFNIGLRHASGDIIVRVDGHCRIAPDYVRRCVESLRATGAQNVGGVQRAIGTGIVERAIAMATSSPFGVGNATFHYATTAGWSDTVYLGAWPKEVFERFGGFDEDLVRNQDDEFNFRIVQGGGKIWLDPSIQSQYHTRGSFRKLWKQYFQYGLYKVRVMQKHRAVASWRHLTPGSFVAALFASMLAALATKNMEWLLAVSGPYLTAGFIASVWVGRGNAPVIPSLFLAYAVLHLSYGLGFLVGLWKWRKGW